MREVNREDKATFLICTHDERVAARCARRITLNDGRVEGVAKANSPSEELSGHGTLGQ